MTTDHNIGPFCGVCGNTAERMIIITPNCCYSGLGRLVCEGCCAVCDLHYGCVAYAALRRRGG